MDSRLPSSWPGAAYFMAMGVFYELMCPVDMSLKAPACPLHHAQGCAEHANTSLSVNLFPCHSVHLAQICLVTSASAAVRGQRCVAGSSLFLSLKCSTGELNKPPPLKQHDHNSPHYCYPLSVSLILYLFHSSFSLPPTRPSMHDRRHCLAPPMFLFSPSCRPVGEVLPAAGDFA